MGKVDQVILNDSVGSYVRVARSPDGKLNHIIRVYYYVNLHGEGYLSYRE